MSGPVFNVAGDVTLWIADSASIHIKTREPNGDPVDLTEEDAVELAQILMKLVDELSS